MKLKKISTSLVCYFVLAAFLLCVAGIEFSHFIPQHHKAEISSEKNLLNKENLVFEEDDDSDDFIHSSHFSTYSYPTFIIKLTLYASSLSSPYVGEKNLSPLKIPLFLQIKSIRI